MKRFKIHCLFAIMVVALLVIVRGTNTFDFDEMLAKWKNTATETKDAVIAKMRQGYADAKATVKTGYDDAKNFVGREMVAPVINRVIQSQERAITNNPYKNSVAHVRRGNELHPEERAYCAQRLPKVKNALEKLLQRSLDGKKIPTIAFVGSGGGYRAMLCTTGSLVGAEKIGLLDTAMYVTALSGSTWALGAWMSTGWSCTDFRAYLEGIVTKSIYAIDSIDARNIADVLATKLAYNQPLTSVDIYGALLANRVLHGFGDECQMVYLSKQAEKIRNGALPYPIYSATDGSEKVASDPHWYEFTPHEIGSPSFELYVPSWGYGRMFNAGRSIDFAPEQSLGFHFATFGSAYAISFGFAWEGIAEKISNVIIKKALETYVVSSVKGKRMFWAEVFNYMKGMSDIPNAYARLETRDTLKLVDAGLTFNLPYPPVSGERAERKADVLIMLDASAGQIPNELRKVEQYARKRGLKFPPIDYTDLDKKTIAVFKDPNDSTVPVVIYMPRISDAQMWAQNKVKPELSQYDIVEGFNMEACTNETGVCDTFNFEYTQQQAKQVMDQMEFNMVANKDTLIEAINWVIDRG
jgi:hypothetical protein